MLVSSAGMTFSRASTQSFGDVFLCVSRAEISSFRVAVSPPPIAGTVLVSGQQRSPVSIRRRPFGGTYYRAGVLLRVHFFVCSGHACPHDSFGHSEYIPCTPPRAGRRFGRYATAVDVPARTSVVVFRAVTKVMYGEHQPL